jgi:hypothetical protein
MTLPKTKLFLAVTGIVAAFAASMSAQTISLDEKGTMLINGSLGSPGVLAVDPISGMTGLAYTLPFAPNPGDILMLATNEPPSANAQSDLIRFIGNQVFFFSLSDDPNPDLADVPVLPALQTPNMTLPEVGPETANSTTWAPGPAGIGGTGGNPNLVYTFISEVPEPGGWVLMTLAGGVLLVMRWRRQALRG